MTIITDRALSRMCAAAGVPLWPICPPGEDVVEGVWIRATDTSVQGYRLEDILVYLFHRTESAG